MSTGTYSVVGACKFCGENVHEIDNGPRAAAFSVTGWEVLRSGGGANRILGRERVPGVVAHRACIERSLVISEGQQEMFA